MSLCLLQGSDTTRMESEIDSQSGSANTSTEEHVARLVCDAG